MTPETKIWRWARNTKVRHKQRGFQVKMTQNELYKLGLQAYKDGCPICGSAFEVGCAPVTINSLTLDIVDPTMRILAPGNVQCVCWGCNNEKNLKSMRKNSQSLQSGRISLKWG